jgi:hypothetical protein
VKVAITKTLNALTDVTFRFERKRLSRPFSMSALGISHIQAASNLQSLTLDRCPANDDMMKAISQLTGLTKLEMIKISGAFEGFMELRSLVNMRSLKLVKFVDVPFTETGSACVIVIHISEKLILTKPSPCPFESKSGWTAFPTIA